MTIPVATCPGLSVLPYARGSLASAIAAAQACGQGSFDCIAVDLPGFLNDRRFFDIPLRLFPLVTALLIKEDSGCALLPFVPSDAAMIAAYMARDRSIELACVDETGAGSAGVIATRLCALLDGERKLLFVCEDHLWPVVEEQLGEAPPELPAPPEAVPAALIFEAPGLLWACGLFGDYPAINLRFFESVRAGHAASFGEHAVLNEILAGHGVDAGTATMRPTQLLVHARERLGLEQARDLAKALLDYPMPTAADAGDTLPAYFVLKPGSVGAAEKSFELLDVFHARPYRIAPGECCIAAEEQQQRLRWVRPFITRQEAKLLGGKSDWTWAFPQEHLFRHRACDLVRELVRRSGRLEGRSIRFDDFTPVVFIFTLDMEGNSTSWIKEVEPRARQIAIGEVVPAPDEPKHDGVYAAYWTRSSVERAWPSHVDREYLTSLSLLYSGPALDIGRYLVITARPKKYRCRLAPDNDKELVGFPLLERGLAWAVKYAHKAVVLVTCSGWRLSPELAAFAAHRQVLIFDLPLTALPAEMVRQLRVRHFMSTPLKRHPESQKITERFMG